MLSTGDNITAENANWRFDGDTAKSFDEHVSKSVPFYREGQTLVCNLSDYFIKNDSVAYEIGCSTGELTTKLAKHNKSKPNARFIGIDPVADMVEIANSKKASNNIENVFFSVEDALLFDFEPSDFIVSYYTVQFIRPSDRQKLIDKIYSSLKWGGAFLLFEKVRAPDARFQDMMTSLYNEYKIEQGYNSDEIVAKSRSLKGVLEPFSSQANVDMLKRSGFVDVMSIMKYVSFEGFLAIK
ncbi:MAG: methyltransferase domain-containing protein [Campylobacterales bacterium]